MNKEKLIELAERLAIKLPKGMPSFDNYDELHFNMSGGNDSIALALLMIYGYKVPKKKAKLVHMRVDGNLDQPAYFDYPETDQHLQYCSQMLDLKLVTIASDKGLKQRIEERGKWPSASTQFCTSYQKRDVYAKWVRSKGPGRYLCLSGERAEESSRRAKNLAKVNFREYKAANAPTKQRFVDWYRPIHHLSSIDVRLLMEYAGIKQHPCYTKYNVSRCSCKFCIFLSPQEMSNIKEAFPEQFNELVQLEERIGHTMKYEKGQNLTLSDFVKRAESKSNQLQLELPCLDW
ncbi:MULTISPECIES: phosphoadenosine phosphosulfate reductase domain-containing protein [Metabacillus]|uniref:phosphoadenosine phosphosulfate reductase domain-containing protein n=1 Tax=Metabacillus TaxID=2675233 RepID=UPI000C805832|nr:MULTISPECIES: phosphoadenosine phosphosulfate reductase family protein [Metabacillus]MCM3444009.1 phosphoadenosine phosphosulfate reductase family protein [Metabacillus halosaccharovorans]PMC34943.1 PAPS reductase/FAD synthetase [Bacillus sp. UMB0899]